MTDDLAALHARENEVRRARLALAHERRDKLTREAGLAVQLSAALAAVPLIVVIATVVNGDARRPLALAASVTGALVWAAAALYLGSRIKRARAWAIDVSIGAAALATLGGLVLLIFGSAEVNRVAVIMAVGLPLAATARFLQVRAAVNAAAALERELGELRRAADRSSGRSATGVLSAREESHRPC